MVKFFLDSNFSSGTFQYTSYGHSAYTTFKTVPGYEVLNQARFDKIFYDIIEGERDPLFGSGFPLYLQFDKPNRSAHSSYFFINTGKGY